MKINKALNLWNFFQLYFQILRNQSVNLPIFIYAFSLLNVHSQLFTCWLENGTLFSSEQRKFYHSMTRFITEWVFCHCICRCSVLSHSNMVEKRKKMKTERHEKTQTRKILVRFFLFLFVCMTMILILFILYDFGKYYDCKYILFM